MLILFFNFIICGWRTNNIGTPIKSMVNNDFVYIYSKEGVLSCFEISTGFYFWRTFIDGVMGYDIHENLIVAANSRYFYRMDNESGVILNMYKHQIKDVQSVAFDGENVFIQGKNMIGLYNFTKMLWKKEVNDKLIGFNSTFTEESKYIKCGKYKFLTENGNIVAEKEEPFRFQVANLNVGNTFFEYVDNGKPLWRFNQDFLGAKLEGLISENYALFSNHTDLLVFDILNTRLLFARKIQILSVFWHNSESICIKAANNTYYSMGRQNLTIEQYNGEVINFKGDNGHYNFKGNIIALPKTCKPIRETSTSDNGKQFLFIVANCSSTINAFIIDHLGRVRQNSVIGKSDEIYPGIVWDPNKTFAFSFLNKATGKSLVYSFSANTTNFRAAYTPDLVVSASPQAVLLANGIVLTHRLHQFSANVPYLSSAPQMAETMAQIQGVQGVIIPTYPAFYKEMVSDIRMEEVYPGFTKIDFKDGRIILQGFDIVVPGVVKLDYVKDIFIIGAFLALMCVAIYSHINTNSYNFWR